MNTTRTLVAIAAAAAALGTGIGSAYAHGRDSGQCQMSGSHRHGMGSGMRQQGQSAPGQPGAMPGSRLTQLKADLKLTAEQEAVWKKFEDGLPMRHRH